MGSWTPSHAGIGEMLSSEMVEQSLVRIAHPVRDMAEATSPVSDEIKAEHYKDLWRVSSGVRDVPSRRAYARVSNDSEYSAAVEFGNGRGDSPKTIDAHYVLTRAVDAARE